MNISDIRASLHRHEIDLPNIGKSIESRMFVFVEVDTNEDVSGFGITGSILPWAIISCIENHLKPALIGRDVYNTEEIHAHVWKKLNSRAYTGVVSNALAAIDIALWDIRGKTENRSIHQLLGGYSDSTLTYATFGYPFFDEQQLADYALKFINDGHKMLKMVVGGEPSRTWKDDVRRVKAAREAIGPDIDLMIDANCWFNPNDARLLARGVADCNIRWFEEPIEQNDARALADFRSKDYMPVAAGQMEGHRWRSRELITHQAVDVIQPNVIYHGGFTETLKVGHMAQAFNLPMANGGGWPIFNMHHLCGLMNGGPVEFHYGMWQTGKHFFEGTPDPVDGRMTLSGRPGLGFTPKYDALEKARITDPKDSLFEGRDSHGYLLRETIKEQS